MELARNNFKKAIAEGRVQIGLWSSLCSNIGAEVVADAGFDWILLDGEHSPNDPQASAAWPPAPAPITTAA
jgi:4-hydroxy-2-oxoheptanedioate aldolase